ncbi:uncharacterized protein METZ01_LOCUS402858, partial [marine metagenome]
MLKVSFIGFRRHAALLRNIFNQKKNIKIYKIFSKTKINNSKYIFCKSISELMDSDVIVIASPTDFHYEHILKLSNFKGYIFCEKPIVGSKLEINRLNKNNKLNISNFYTNFNFIFNKLNDLIKKIHLSKKFGKIIKINIHISHASALKKSWRKEWRLNTKSKLGPLETTGIHYIDMVRNLFGNIQLIDSYHFSQLKLREIDTSDVFFKSPEILFNFRFSYCESPRIYFFIIFKNGYAEYDGLK